MLLDDDVVTDGQAEPSPFPGRLRRKERVEQLSPSPQAGIPVPLSRILISTLVAEALGRRSQRRLVVATHLLSALRFVAA